jgi:hypothetical protein
MIRLATIDVSGLAAEAHDRVLGRVLRYAQHLGAVDPLPILAACRGPSNVRLSVQQIAHYAQTGTPPEGRAELVGEYIQTLVDLDLVPDAETLHGERDPSDPLHVVVMGALARERLDKRQSVPEAWLAVLAGVAASRIRQLVGAGELRRTSDGIHAADARRWLEARKQ